MRSIALARQTSPMDEAEQQRRRLLIRDVMPRSPFIAWLGLLIERYEPDEVATRVPFRDELTNDGTYYHGGVIASAIDTAGAAAAWSNHDFDKGSRASTVSMTVQYVGACKQSDLLCSARAVKRGKELTFTEITATDADGKIVAHALQTYRIV
jgi:uncharacterized protein (TIGR00369 family)